MFMVNLLAPAAIIFANDDLTPAVKAVVQRQLFITDTMSGTEFDARIAVDPGYVDEIHGNGNRVLVIRPYTELDNRELADVVLFFKAGLVSVLKNNYGPPGIVYTIQRMYLSQIFFTK